MSEERSISDVDNVEEINQQLEHQSSNPPKQSKLKKQREELRSKYKIMRIALIEQKIAEIEEQIKSIASGDILESKNEIDVKKEKSLWVASEKKRLRLETIIKQYESKLKAIKEEAEGRDQEMIIQTTFQMQDAKSKSNPKQLNGETNWCIKKEEIDKDLEIIQRAKKEIEIAQEQSTLVHSD